MPHETMADWLRGRDQCNRAWTFRCLIHGANKWTASWFRVLARTLIRRIEIITKTSRRRSLVNDKVRLIEDMLALSAVMSKAARRHC